MDASISLAKPISFKPLLTAGIAFVSAATVIHLQWTRLAEKDAPKTLTQQEYLLEEQQIETNIDLIEKIPSLGFDNLVANWAFLNFIQYFGDDNARKSTGYSVTPKFFDVAVERDPYFLDMYPMLSSTITLFGGEPTKSIQLLNQGLEQIPEKLKPEAYFIWQAKATDELLFLGKPEEAQKSYLKAAEWAALSNDEDVQLKALRSLQTANFLAQNPDSRTAQIASWFNVLSSAIDDRTRGRAIEQIQALGGKVTFNDGVVDISFPEE